MPSHLTGFCAPTRDSKPIAQTLVATAPTTSFKPLYPTCSAPILSYWAELFLRSSSDRVLTLHSNLDYFPHLIPAIQTLPRSRRSPETEMYPPTMRNQTVHHLRLYPPAAPGGLSADPVIRPPEGLPPSSRQQGCFHSVYTTTSFLRRSWHTLTGHNSPACCLGSCLEFPKMRLCQIRLFQLQIETCQ